MDDVVGIVNYIGYLYCIECAEKIGRLDSDKEIFKNSNPHAYEECDICNQILNKKEKSKG